VQSLGCDFLVCSAYKFFGPHVGALYGRYELLDSLRAYRVRPAPADPPGKFETGTNNFEGIAGLLGALEYLAWVGETYGGDLEDLFSEDYSDPASDISRLQTVVGWLPLPSDSPSPRPSGTNYLLDCPFLVSDAARTRSCRAPDVWWPP
jgi:hypothetical protein